MMRKSIAFENIVGKFANGLGGFERSELSISRIENVAKVQSIRRQEC